MLMDHTNEVKLTDDIKVILRYPYIYDMANLPADISESTKVFTLLNTCITSVIDGDEVAERTDFNEKELEEFVDSFTTEQFTEVMNFFNTMPKVRHLVKVTNPKTKKKSEVVLEGLQSFLG